MADKKTYDYLKLKEGFFDSEDIMEKKSFLYISFMISCTRCSSQRKKENELNSNSKSDILQKNYLAV